MDIEIEEEVFLMGGLWLIMLLILIAVMLYFSSRYFKKRDKNETGTTTEGLVENLSRREREVLKEALLDKSIKEIATALNIENSTVKSHLNNIYKILKVKNRKELVNKKRAFFYDF